ncbi:hypothetical protein DACRYDRAFT_111565 [Dacryopinax primogenitus]|uniref:Uncharacterized protein n=1 Tax=Dacryopinax primogenitus (strain DJM 731) TaxID=1858805 RepID=M5FQ43_DACPD|nr:uncharacterized protein DACRYDRAFT_111565 [Dacryopinax primogenitus]EJT97518.1 hypothetical protein DACRYDRAFT_111565 [Dacryopinax primogenitus]
MRVVASEPDICASNCHAAGKYLALCIPKPRSCYCLSSLTSFLTTREKAEKAVNRLDDVDAVLRGYNLQTFRPEFFTSAEYPSYLLSRPQFTRSSSRLSDVYDRMFPEPQPLNSAPLLLSPIEVIDVAARIPPCLTVPQAQQPFEKPVHSDASNAPTTPPLADISCENSEAVCRSVLAISPSIGIDMPLTPPYTPAQQKASPPLPVSTLSSPFTPAPEAVLFFEGKAPPSDREDTMSSPTSDTASLIFPRIADIAHSSSVSIHSPETPQYSAHLIRLCHDALRSMTNICSQETRTLLPELHLPDWTLDIQVEEEDFDECSSESSEVLPLRGILRQPSTDRVNLTLTPGRSVKWAPDDTLAQMRYISVDGNLYGVDERGMHRPLTLAEEVKQAEYEQSRKWI